LVLAAAAREHRAALVLVQPTPDPERFTDLQSVLTALGHHRTALTDLFGLRLSYSTRWPTFVVRVEEDS
jgi:hypothetical protein